MDMARRFHFFTFVLIILTTISLNGVAPQTNAARLPKFGFEELEKENGVPNGAPYESIKRFRSSARVLIEKDVNNPGSIPNTPQREDDPADDDVRANPRPRVMGHGHYRVWRSQPSSLGEAEEMEGREVLIPKKPKRSNPKALSPGPCPKT
ncbi:hypothetical protein Tco_0223497 [Tanacetum coccineum]